MIIEIIIFLIGIGVGIYLFPLVYNYFAETYTALTTPGAQVAIVGSLIIGGIILIILLKVHRYTRAFIAGAVVGFLILLLTLWGFVKW
ncbi:MAG: hypothetical protein AB1485_06400 [Candidatus Thermoplasmatota archaeon]